jgi:hypothetical protein
MMECPMKIYQLFLIFILASTSCSNVQFIPSSLEDNGVSKKYPPVPLEQVIIYRSMKPIDATHCEELGSIVVRGDNPLVDQIYKDLRKAASNHGAHYVVDLKLNGKNEMRTRNYQVTDNKGKVTNVSETYWVVAYTVTGTLLRRTK